MIKFTATQAWLILLTRIREEGYLVEVKGARTEEILFGTAEFDMNYPFIEHPKRYVNKKFRAAEAYFICHGDNRTENLAQYNENIAQFSDDGYIFNGAYGPPFNKQLHYVVDTLLRDMDSRQAVLTIWKQNPNTSKDIRCTLSLQWIIRNGVIDCFVNMRSSDAIWGLTYDWTLFTFMTLRVLTYLNEMAPVSFGPFVRLGTMHWTAASSHIYDKHFNLVEDILGYSEVSELEKAMKLPQEFLISWKSVTDYLHEEMSE